MKARSCLLVSYLVATVALSATGCSDVLRGTPEYSASEAPSAVTRNMAGSEFGAAAAAANEAQISSQHGTAIDRQGPTADAEPYQIKLKEQQRAEDARMIDELRQRGIDVRYSERGVVVNLPDVLFSTGKAQLTPSAREVVFEIAQVLKRAPTRNLVVEGHTDSVGTIQYNYELSLARAEEVANALLAEAIPRSQISTRAYGETTPIASNSTEDGRKHNRRVEVIILKATVAGL
jgi:outer membrane protein OmpA-like peptidoglycan-associated protein